MKTQKHLILGGTGKTGSRVVQRLKQQGEFIRIGSRQENPSFDWNDESTWTNALEDMDTIYISYQPDLAVPGALKTIKKLMTYSKKANIKKMVLLSGKGEKEAELCEQVVMSSDFEWTIVRASWFNQNFSEGFFLQPIQAGEIALPKSEALVPYVDADDIADVVLKTLLDDNHNGKIYELTGPEQLTFKQAIDKIAKTQNKEIKFSSITVEEYASQLRVVNVPEDYIWLITYLFNEVLVPKNSVVTNDIELVLGRKPKTFEAYVKDMAKTGIWKQPK